jgi:16S rRNA processing protein RimM
MERTSGSTSSTDGADTATVRVALGQVSGAHGLRGQIRIRYFGGDPDNLLQLSALTLSQAEDGADPREYEVERAAPGRRSELRVTLAGVDSREAAEALRGLWVTTVADQLESLPEGEYYTYELVGCEVLTEDGRSLGTVREVWSTGTDVLVVEDEQGATHLVPARKEFLCEIDIEARRIRIDPPPGLIDGV